MNSFMIEAGRKRRATVTLDEQPGAHTGSTRKYIPGYADSNIVYLDTVSGNDGNSGATELLAKLTYASAATAAGSTKKIRVINDGAALSTNITKPTEMKRGVSGTISSSLTAPVATWTQAGTPSFGTELVWDIGYAHFLSKFVACGDGGRVATSSDGDIWTQKALTLSTGLATLFCVFVSEEKKIVIAAGNPNPSNTEIVYSLDGETWENASMPVGPFGIRAITYIPSAKVFVAAGGDKHFFTSTDGINWDLALYVGDGQVPNAVFYSKLIGKLIIADTAGKIYLSDESLTFTEAATPSFGSSQIYHVAESGSVLVAVGEAGKIAYSTDGNIWTQAATPSFGGSVVYSVAWCEEISRFVAVGASGKIAYSTDGNIWTQAATPSFGGADVLGVIYNPLLGKVGCVGASGKIAYSTAFANTISANVAGFTIQAVQYSGTITAYNCTMKQPGTPAALSTENCWLAESGAHISNNAQKHQGLLVVGSAYFTTTPATQNAFSLTRYTVAGGIYIYNGSATYFEEIKDGIVTEGIKANFPVVVESGNVRGTSTNVTFGLGISVADPDFVDETEYQLKREVNGYDQDSICVEKSSYYFNSAGDRRDIGAWSYTETAEFYIYERAYEMRKPSAKDSTAHTERQPEYLYWGEDMTPDVATDPDARGEELVLNYRTLPIADVEFFRYLRSLRDRTVRIDYDPSWAPASTVTVDGNQSAGEDVLVLLTSTLEAGQKLTISGKTYSVIRMSGTTKAVLNRSLQDAVTNGQTIAVSDTSGKGIFQFTTDTDINLTRFYENNRAYLKGVKMKFVRKSE